MKNVILEMDQLFEEALLAAQALCPGQNDDMGMPSISIQWHPYDCKWIAEASFSNNKRITVVYDTPSQALAKLIAQLRD